MGRVMSDLIFEVTQEADGGFVAECLTEAMPRRSDQLVAAATRLPGLPARIPRGPEKKVR
jgi:hypothetical protein